MFKNAWHAVQHVFGKRIYATEVLVKINRFSTQETHFSKDATYNTDGSGIVDSSFASPSSGFGYVADGTGHNNPMMAPVLGGIFDNFNRNYQKALEKKKPATEVEWSGFIKKELTKLGQEIHNNPNQVLNDPRKPSMTHLDDNTLKPAFSFAQVAKIGNQRKLFSAQFSDTILLIKHSDGTFDVSLAAKKPDDYGLGDNSTPKRRNILVHVMDIQEGDEILGFSDGIGEFLSMEDLQGVINANQERTALLNDLKNAIIEKGKAGTYDPDGRKEMVGTSANGMGVIKFHDPDNSKNHDDISLFRMKVN